MAQKFLNGVHISGTTQLDFMPTHESEGIITLGRYDSNTSRYHNIKSYVSSTLASNYLKFSLHNGTADTVVDALTLKGDGSATFAGDIKQSNRIVLQDNGTIQWGASANYGNLTWDTGYALMHGQSGMGIKFGTNGSTLALTLDTSQNATFAGNVTVSGTSSSFNTGNSGTFITNDASNYPRFTMTNASAQIGLFRAGGNAGGMYIGGSGDGFRLYTTGFAQKLLVDQSGNATFAGGVNAGTKIGLPDGGDLFWDGGYGVNKPVLAANGTTMKMYPSGASGGVQFSLTPTTATFAGTVSASNLSGTNTGDQDLSSYLTSSSTFGDFWEASSSALVIQSYGESHARINRPSGSAYAFALMKDDINENANNHGQNFDVSFDFNVESGNASTHFGWAFNYQDDNDFYAVIIRDGNDVRVQKQVNGTQTYPITSVTTTNVVGDTIDTDDGWHNCRIQKSKNYIIVEVDGVTQIAGDIEASLTYDFGRMGLTIYDHACEFKNIKVKRGPTQQLILGSGVDPGSSWNGIYDDDNLVLTDGSLTINPHRRGDYGEGATTATSTSFNSRLNIWSANEDHITFGGASTHMVSAWEDWKIWINNDSSQAGNLRLYNKNTKVEFARFSGNGTSSFLKGNFRFSNEQNAGSRLELYNNRQDASNVEVFRIAAYNSSEVAGIHFYRGSGGNSGNTRIFAKKDNSSSLEQVVQFGTNGALTTTFSGSVNIHGTNATNAESVLLRGITSDGTDLLGSIRTANTGGYNQDMRFYTSNADGTSDEDLTLTLHSTGNATFASNLYVGNDFEAVGNTHKFGNGGNAVEGSIRLGGANAAGGRLFFQYNGDSSYIDCYGGHGSTERYRDLYIASRTLKLKTGGATTALTLDSSQNATFAGTVTATNLSGSNTGDQDLSSFLTASSNQSKYLNRETNLGDFTYRGEHSTGLYPTVAQSIVSGGLSGSNTGMVFDCIRHKVVESFFKANSSTAFAECSSTVDFNNLLNGNSAHNYSTIGFQNTALDQEYIMYFGSFGYSFVEWLTMDHQTSSNVIQYYIETTGTAPSNDAGKVANIGTGGWSVKYTSAAISSWPGHTVSNIHQQFAGAADNHVRIRFKFTTVSAYTCYIGHLGMLTSYGSATPDYTMYRDTSGTRNIRIYGDLRVTAGKKIYLDSGGDSYIQESSGDNIVIVSGGEESIKHTGDSIIVNDGALDRDFRVESNGSANMLFVDGALNKVGINKAVPNHTLDVVGNLQVKHNNSAIALSEHDNGAYIWLDGVDGDFTGGDYYNIAALGSAKLSFGYGAAEKMYMDNSGNLFTVGDVTAGDDVHVTGNEIYINGENPYIRGTHASAFRFKHTSGQTFYFRPDENGSILCFVNSPAVNTFSLAAPSFNAVVNNGDQIGSPIFSFNHKAKQVDGTQVQDSITMQASYNDIANRQTKLTIGSGTDEIVVPNLTVTGTTTTLNTTTLVVEDKNIEIGNVASPSDTTGDGGGITLKAAADKTILWDNARNAWKFNQHVQPDGTYDLGGSSYRWATAYVGNVSTTSTSTFGGNINLDDHVDHSPSLIWTNQADENWSMYNNTSGKLQLEQDGTQRVEFSSGGVDVANTVTATGLDINGDADVSGTLTAGTFAPTSLSVGGTNGEKFIGSKSVAIGENTFTTVLTVSMASHRSCYVKIFATGDWSSHSAVCFLGEYFLKNGGGSYGEPGMIIREVDDTHSDTIVSKIVDPSGTSGNRDFAIQLKGDDTIGAVGPTLKITYEVMGQFVSIT